MSVVDQIKSPKSSHAQSSLGSSESNLSRSVDDTTPGISRKKKRMEWWKKHKKDKPSNGVSGEKNANGEAAGAAKPKLRNRETIAKPDSLKYEPNYTRGFHTKILQNLYTDTRRKKKSSSSVQKHMSTDTSPAKRKSSETSPMSDRSKKPKPEPTQQVETFDSYTFSLGLINGNVDLSKTEASKDSKHKYVLFIGNLPYDVTRGQLEEHFRKTGGIKSIRIPREKGSDMGKGFAYMEFDSRISHGIALRLHQTTLGGRKINVEFTSIGGGKSEARREKLKAKNRKRQNMKRH